MDKILCKETYFDNDIETLFLESLSNYVYGASENISILNESIGYNPNLKEYSILLESAKEIKDCEKSIKDLKIESDDKKESVVKKLIDSLKKLSDWYFKADPDKKFKTFHIILRLIVNILLVILPIIYPYGNIVKVVSNTKFGKMIPNIHLPRKLKPDSFLHKVLSKFIITAIKDNRVVIVREGIVLTLIRTLLLTISQSLRKIISNIEIKSNIKDIDKNIKALDNAIDEYNRMIESSNSDVVINDLKEQRRALEDTLAKLIRIKESKE